MPRLRQELNAFHIFLQTDLNSDFRLTTFSLVSVKILLLNFISSIIQTVRRKKRNLTPYIIFHSSCSIFIPMSDQSYIIAMTDFEMDFGYKPQSDIEYRARIYGKNRLKRTSENVYE